MYFKKPLYLLLFFVIGCQVNTKESKLESIEIDLNQELHEVNFSDLINNNIEIIPFDNYDETNEPIFFSNISKLCYYKEEFYILDFIYSQKILVFNQEGEFQRSIGYRGDGPGGFKQAMDFDVINNQLKVLDYGRMLNFNLKGEFLSSEKTKDLVAIKFKKFDSGYAFITGGGDTHNLALTNNEYKKESSFFPYHTRALNVMSVNPIYQSYNGDIVYRRQLNDTLFKINDFQRPVPYLYIDFKQNKSNINELLNSSNPEEAISNAATQFCNIFDYYETKEYKYLAFSVNGEAWVYLYSNRSNKSILYKRSNLINEIMFDPKSSPVGVIGDKFVFKANPQNVLAGLNSYKGNSKQSQKLKNISDKIDKEGNPILFMVEFDF